MIYTLTFNPSLDYIVSVKDFALGKTNRTTQEQMLCGGKGLNVSMVLKNLGIENTAFGFIAGFIGAELKRMAEDSGIICNFIELEQGCSRINIKMKDFDGTEINGMGPVIDETAIEQLKKQLHMLKQGDILVLAGSIPQSISLEFTSSFQEKNSDKQRNSALPSFTYRDILLELQGKGIEFVDKPSHILKSRARIWRVMKEIEIWSWEFESMELKIWG